ncbi:MAG: hypothetical protein KF841_13155 [Phycisphaerae bacterium]|nr:hypothetical protein [Phycisphaerae bacterium]
MAVSNLSIRRFLLCFIGSICVCALIGIYIIATGNMGRIEGQILGTTATFAGTALLALFSAVPSARRLWHPIGPAGIAFVPIPFLMTSYYIWRSSILGRPTYDAEFEEWYPKYLALAWIVGVTLPIVGLHSLARLKPGYAWARAATIGIGLMLDAILLISIFGEIHSDEIGRILAILCILTVCGCVAVPILHRVSAIPLAERVHTAKLELQLTCPRCSTAQTLAAGGARCCACGLKITVEIEEDTCRSCGYPLYKIDSAVCPECGTPIATVGASPSADVAAEGPA